MLVLGPHPDDEIGCAGTIARLIEAGYDVHHCFFSRCRDSLPGDAEVQQLLNECEQSRRILGIPASNCRAFDFPVRRFPEWRQDILEALVEMRDTLKPGLVLVPNKSDIHQDHATLAMEAIRAFKHSSILGYELPWNMLESHHDCLITLEERHLELKLSALSAYRTQAERHYANRQFFESLANIRGVQARTRYAECFEVIRLIY